MTDPVGDLERLHRLHAEGALSDNEFAAAKARLLAPVDPPTIAAARPLLPWAVAGAGLLAAVGLAFAIFGLPTSLENRDVNAGTSAPAAPTNVASPVPPSSIRDRSATEQLAIAFRAAFDHDRRATLTVEGSQLTFEPGRHLWLADRAVLISPGRNRDDCHACAGALAIHYLRPSGETFEVTGAWPGAVSGWGWGAPPTDWAINNSFASNPVIFAQGGFMGQGIVCSSATLTELRPEGPVESEIIRTGYSDGGAMTDERVAAGEREQELTGVIANIQRDQSFEVRFTGTARFTERYVRRDNRFVPVARSRLMC